MANIQLEPVLNNLKRLYPSPQINTEWLRACLTELYRQISPSSPTLQQQIKFAHEQFLSSHLGASTLPGTGLPRGLDLDQLEEGEEQLHQTVVFEGGKKEACLLMVMSITEVGASAFNLRVKLHERQEARLGVAKIRPLANEDGGDAAEEDDDGKIKYPRGMLKLELSDGFGMAKAIEYKRVDALRLGETRLGSKLLLSNVRVLRGLLLLTPESCTVKGYQVDEMCEGSMEEDALERGFKARMNIDEDEARPPNPRPPSPPRPPARCAQPNRPAALPPQPPSDRSPSAAIPRLASVNVEEDEEEDDYIPPDFDLPDAHAGIPSDPPRPARQSSGRRLDVFKQDPYPPPEPSPPKPEDLDENEDFWGDVDMEMLEDDSFMAVDQGPIAMDEDEEEEMFAADAGLGGEKFLGDAVWDRMVLAHQQLAAEGVDGQELLMDDEDDGELDLTVPRGSRGMAASKGRPVVQSDDDEEEEKENVAPPKPPPSPPGSRSKFFQPKATPAPSLSSEAHHVYAQNAVSPVASTSTPVRPPNPRYSSNTSAMIAEANRSSSAATSGRSRSRTTPSFNDDPMDSVSIEELCEVPESSDIDEVEALAVESSSTPPPPRSTTKLHPAPPNTKRPASSAPKSSASSASSKPTTQPSSSHGKPKSTSSSTASTSTFTSSVNGKGKVIRRSTSPLKQSTLTSALSFAAPLPSPPLLSKTTKGSKTASTTSKSATTNKASTSASRGRKGSMESSASAASQSLEVGMSGRGGGRKPIPGVKTGTGSAWVTRGSTSGQAVVPKGPSTGAIGGKGKGRIGGGGDRDVIDLDSD